MTTSSTARPGPDPRPLAPRLADEIREAILAGELKAGETIQQADLAQRYGVSRIPLREALRQLEAEGLVELNPYRGAMVPQLTTEDARDIYYALSALDQAAARLAIGRQTTANLDAATAILDSMERQVDLRLWGNLSDQFYEYLLGPARTPRLLAMTRMMRVQSRRYALLLLAHPEQRLAQTSHLRRLLTLFRAGEVEAAAELIKQNEQQALATSLVRLGTFPHNAATH